MRSQLSARLHLEPLESRDAPAVFHVAPTGSDQPGLGSPQAPFRSIQYAINQAASDDTILVASGTYTYNRATEISLPTLYMTAVAVVINKNITLLGGYSTTNWAAPNYQANPTIIDGGGSVRGVFAIDVGGPTTLRMEGFTVRNGVATGNANPAVTPDERSFAFGGGVFLDHAQGVIRDVVFENNQAIGDNTNVAHGGAGSGGGLSIRNTPTGGLVTLERLQFRNNAARGGNGPERGGYGVGGGLSATDGAKVFGNSLLFENNVAIAGNTNGPGNTIMSRTNNEFFDGFGGGAAIGKGSTVTFLNLQIHNNQAIGGNAPNGNAGGGFGGGLFAEGTAALPLTLVVRDSDISKNLARGGDGRNQDALTVPAGVALGGGVMAYNATVTMERVSILDNFANGGTGEIYKGSGGGGGGAFLREGGNSTTTLINTVIANNRALMGGGSNDFAGGGGGGLFLKGTDATLSHVTLANNGLDNAIVPGQGMQGTALVALNFGSPTPTTVNIFNSIIAGFPNTSQAVAVHAQPGNQVTFNQVLMTGHSKNTNADGQPKPAGTFQGLQTIIDAPNAGFAATMGTRFNHHLLATSPAVDRGVGQPLTNDFDNKLRAGIPDLGADELDSSQPIPSTIGVFDPAAATWYLRDQSSAGGPDTAPFVYGGPNWISVVGDWDGNGTTTIGVIDPTTATWYLRNSSSAGGPDIAPFQYGAPGWIPVVGDWDGNGTTTIGMFDPFTATWYVRNSNSAGSPDVAPFQYGGSGWTPMAGDWDGNGTTTIGVFDPRAATWYLRNSTSAGGPDFAPFAYGGGFWKPVVGDWDGNGTTTIGIFDPVTANWYQRNSNSAGGPDFGPYAYGGGFWQPVGGRWKGRTGSPLLAVDAPIANGPGTDQLDLATARSLAQQLIGNLRSAGVDARLIDTLQQTELRITDLPGRMLGLTNAGTIYLDQNAAGRGWYVGATPAGSGRMDLQTVLLHELAHLAGSEHVLNADNLMALELAPGIRRAATDEFFGNLFTD